MTAPLISCLCVTRERRAFLAQSITYFESQDYPNKELVILEDGEQSNWELALGLNYHYMPGALSIGEKRNLIAHLAHGAILCHWDDDDYYSPRRLSVQALPLLEGRADVTAYHMSLLLDAEQGVLWKCPEREHERLFKYDVRASTLMYMASWFHGGLRYVPRGIAEDVRYLAEMLRGGATLTRIVDPSSYICVRHSGNSTPALDTTKPGWEQVELSAYLTPEAQLFYGQFKGVSSRDT